MTLVIFRIGDVCVRTGLSRSMVWRLVHEGNFPKPVNLSARARGWIAAEVDEWIEARIAESRRPAREA